MVEHVVEDAWWDEEHMESYPIVLTSTLDK